MSVPVIAGQLVSIAIGVRRLTAPNPGMMTGPGTNSYLIGDQEIAVIDPGPEIESHLQQIADAGNIRWIIVTHTHPDHSPGARRLAEITGASLVGMPAPPGPHQDSEFSPDQIPQHEEVLQGPDFSLSMLHTPGHASNHICILDERNKMLFTGDHVMNGSTVVIDPPDGDMQEYLKSLADLKRYPIDTIAPGHGEVFADPISVIDWIIEHRLQREAKVEAALLANPGLTSIELVPVVYKDVDERLYGWAERSLLAHLIKLEKEGRAIARDSKWTAIEA